MKIKDNCRIEGYDDCPMLEKRTGKKDTQVWYNCLRHTKSISNIADCEYAGDPEKQKEFLKSKKGELTMAEKMKQTLVETKQKINDLLDAEWDNVAKAYENHGYNLSAGIKITLDGESINLISIVAALSFYPEPKTEIKTDKFIVDEKQKKLPI